MTLYINCCPREESRTDCLAKALLGKLGNYEEVNLYETELQALNKESIMKRSRMVEDGNFSDAMFDYAKQFASADVIVIAAPFWDSSFPAQLKVYIENIYVTGIVSKYDENGMPQGLCKADKLYYVTTAGGPYDGRFSYEYLKSLGKDFLGIPNVELIKAECLDIVGNNPEQILDEAMEYYGLK